MSKLLSNNWFTNLLIPHLLMQTTAYSHWLSEIILSQNLSLPALLLTVKTQSTQHSICWTQLICFWQTLDQKQGHYALKTQKTHIRLINRDSPTHFSALLLTLTCSLLPGQGGRDQSCTCKGVSKLLLLSLNKARVTKDLPPSNLQLIICRFLHRNTSPGSFIPWSVLLAFYKWICHSTTRLLE